MPSHVAANCTNTIQCARVWLARLSFEPLLRDSEKINSKGSSGESSKKNIFTRYMEGMRIQPLKEAYVLLIPTAGEAASVPADPANAILCRTSKEGELLRIDEGKIDSGIPSSEPSNWVLFTPDTTVIYYWTLSPKRFRRVIKDARKDYASATLLHDFSSFQVSPQFASGNYSPLSRKFLFELLEKNSDWWMADSIFEHALMVPPSANAGPGFFQGFVLKFPHDGTKELKTYLPYVLARRRVADAIYCGELAQYHALGLRQRSAEEFAVFAQVKDIFNKATTEELDPEFVTTTHYEYYQYGRKCGLNSRIDRKLYSDAVDVSPGRDGWKDAQARIAKDYGYLSPSMQLDIDQPQYKHMETVNHSDAMRYFDFYRFSINPEVQPALQYALESEPRICSQLESLSKRIAAFIGAIAYFDVVMCLGTYRDEATVEKQIHARYLDLSLDVCHAWWKTFEPDQSSWERLKPYIEDTGSFGDKFFGTYSEHFNNFEHIEKYNKLLESNVKQAKQLVNKMVTWNELIGGQKANLKDPFDKSFEVNADLKKGLVTIRKDGKDVAKLQLLLKDVKEGTTTVAEEVRVGNRRVGWRKVAVPEKYPRFELKPQFKEVKAWPAWLSVFGQVLSLTASISEAVKTWGKDEDSDEGIIVTAQVAKDSLQLIDGFSSALHATFPYAEETGMVIEFAKVGEIVKGPGLLLEAILNLQEGAMILVLQEDSPAASAVRRGDFYEGGLQEARGMVLVASPVLGLAEGAGAVLAGEAAGAAFAAALPMLGLGLALAGLIVVGINIALYIHHGPANSMEDIEKALDKARVREFGDSLNVPEKHRTEDSLKRFSLTVEKLVAGNVTQSAWRN